MDVIVSKLLKACEASEIEIEARIRKQIVNKHSVQRLINAHTEWKIAEYSERKKIAKHNRKCTYRSRVEGQHQEVICKSSIAKYDVNDAWCTVHVSVETAVPSMMHALDAVPETTVTRYRTVIEGHYVDVVVDDPRVEVEACDAGTFDPDAMLRVVRCVCATLQGNAKFLGYYDWKTVMHVSGTAFGPFCIDKKRYQKPRTMAVDVLFRIGGDPGSWAVTPKVDGVRKFIVAFNGRVFSLGVADDVALEGVCDGLAGITVLDCELADGVFYAFDVPVYQSEYCGGMVLCDREDIMEAAMKNMDINVRAKPYAMFSSFDGLHRVYERFVCEYAMDGLIFVRPNEGYMQTVAKWKTYSTVDLEARSGSLYTCDEWKVNLEHTELPSDAFGVWEFSLVSLPASSRAGTLTAIRARPDKPQANSRHIVQKNLFSSVPGTIFTGEGFYIMRKYHNMVKRRVISDAKDVKARFLDIGTGQGGDLAKWSRAASVFCVEPNAESVSEMLDRCGPKLRSKVSIFNGRLADLDHDLVSGKIDIFTAFFCMNQWLPDDWEILKNTVLQKGSKNCRLLAIALTYPKEHRSGNLEVTMRGSGKYNIKMHGTRIMDIDETVVLPKDLTKLMKSCGLRLAKEEVLDGNDFMTRDERRLSSMYTLFVYSKNF